MTKNIKFLKTYFKNRFPILRKSVSILSFLSFGFATSHAASLIHNWSENHRGYSIELIPGTGGTTGIPAEYVAAGTIFPQPPSVIPNNVDISGWHFMRLDQNGNILASKIAWGINDQALKVVDIAAESSTEFRITMQGRSKTLGSEHDYIYIKGVDLNGNALPTAKNPSVCIKSGNRNMYPTHSYSVGGQLFICGYTGENSQYPNIPNIAYTSKFGFMMRVDVNVATVPYLVSYWNSPTTGNGKDYDMPLRIVPSSYNSVFPLLVTGALNDQNNPNQGIGRSAIFLAKYDINCNWIDRKAIQVDEFQDGEGLPAGSYGVDIRGEIGAYDIGSGDVGDNVILYNWFSDYTPYERKWGIIRVQNDFTAYPPTVNAARLTESKKGWANQFLELHTTNQGSGNHTYVVGQQTDVYNELCMQPMPPSAQPVSTANVDPFITMVDVGNTYWNFTSGYTNIPLGPMINQNLYLSSQRTTALHMDYLMGTQAYGTTLEDVSRLYTFSSLEHHYNNPTQNNPPIAYPALIAPTGEALGMTSVYPWLRTKFLGLGFNYNEPNCANHIKDCPEHKVMDTYNPNISINKIVELDPPAAILSSREEISNAFPTTINCTTGHYKSTTGIIALDADDNGLRIFPNPTTSDLTIQVDNILTGKDAIEFNLADMTGKVVYSNNKFEAGSAIFKISLPELAPGIYIGTVVLNGNKQSRKITIQ